MSRVFKTWRDPYDRGFSVNKREIEIEEGLTILVGCNGYGKSTLLKNIRDTLEEKEIPCYDYDNQVDSPIDNKDQFLFGPNSDLGILSTIMQSSEGENISIGMHLEASHFRNFIKTGISKKQHKYNAFAAIFDNEADYIEDEVKYKERWFLFDSIDSGYSINNVINVKELFHYIINDAKKDGYTVYILVSANAYEFANNGEKCLDPVTGKYMTFKDYEEYKKYILKTFDKKMKREEVGEKVLERRAEKKARKEKESNSKDNDWRVRGD